MGRNHVAPADTSPLQIMGLENQPDHEALVRNMVSKMGPAVLPKNGLFVMPDREFQKNASKLASGIINGHAATNSGGENFGGPGQRTFVDGAYSVPAWGQVFVSDKLLRDPSKLQKTLAHELGHLAAQGNSSEDAADRYRDLYLQRAQQAQRIESGAQQLEPNAQAILSGALRGMQPEPQSPLANIAGNNTK